MSVNLAESGTASAAVPPAAIPAVRVPVSSAGTVPGGGAETAPAGGRRGGRGARRRIVVEAVKFAVVGGSGVLVNFLVFNLLLRGPGAPAMTASVVAGCVAMGTNYLGFRYFTYRDRDARTRRQLALFFVFSGLGVVMESVLFSVGYHGLGLRGPVGSNAVKAASVVVSSGFRFLVCRTWVFRHDARHDARRAA